MDTEVLDIKDVALDKFREITTPKNLETLAQAIADVGIPANAISDMFVAKVLLTQTMMLNNDDPKFVVANTERRGLYKRTVNKRSRTKNRRKRDFTTPTRRSVTSMDTKDGTVDYKIAIETVRDFCGKTTPDRFMPFIRRNVSEWLECVKQTADDQPSRIPFDALATRAFNRRRSAFQGTVASNDMCVIPVDRYLAMTIMGKDYETNMEALRIVAEHTRRNFLYDEDKNVDNLAESKLPIGKGFKDRCLYVPSPKYSKSFFIRKRESLWNYALSAWAFSMYGRLLDTQQRTRDLIADLTKLLDDRARNDYMSFVESAGFRCIMCDAPETKFNYRVIVCAVYGADVACRLAMPVVSSRHALMRSHKKRADIVEKIFRRDLILHGSSLSRGIAASDLHNFEDLFGKKVLWDNSVRS